MADKAGLKQGDLVIQINDTFTDNLSNEQLRKIMRQRLQLNSISLRLLSQQVQEQGKLLSDYILNFFFYFKSLLFYCPLI